MFLHNEHKFWDRIRSLNFVDSSRLLYLNSRPCSGRHAKTASQDFLTKHFLIFWFFWFFEIGKLLSASLQQRVWSVHTSYHSPEARGATPGRVCCRRGRALSTSTVPVLGIPTKLALRETALKRCSKKGRLRWSGVPGRVCHSTRISSNHVLALPLWKSIVNKKMKTNHFCVPKPPRSCEGDCFVGIPNIGTSK